MDDGQNPGDRRQRVDRREGAEPGDNDGRRGSTAATSVLAYILRALGTAVVLVAVIVFAVKNVHPIYATRGTLGDELRKHAPGAAAAIGAGDSTNVDRLMATAKFQAEKRNFYEDVMRLKQVDSARADSIAQFAVREAYVRGISPAIIFGVMLTENSRFISKAQSNVGAVGLMQVYPKVWLTKEMTKLFGRDLASDSTNVKYGVFILSHYFNPKTKDGGTGERDWATALLRYNGCVRGTNTPRCHTYPNKVQNFVENQATSICSGRSFYDCIAKPFINGLFKGGRLALDDSTTKAAVDTAAAIAADSVRRGATVVAAGEVAGASRGMIALAPVVVQRPDSVAPVPAAPAPGTALTTAPTAPTTAIIPPAPPRAATSSRSGATAKKAAPARSSAKRPAPRAAAKSAPAPRKTKPTKVAKAPARAAPKKTVKPNAAIPAPPKPITIKVP